MIWRKLLFATGARDASREKQLRRLARRLGLDLIRSKSWIGSRPSNPTYALIDPVRNTLVLADPESGYGMSLDEVDAFLKRMGAPRDRLEA